MSCSALAVMHYIEMILQDYPTTIIHVHQQGALKRQTKIAADDILIFYFHLSKKIRLDFSFESSA